MPPVFVQGTLTDPVEFMGLTPLKFALLPALFGESNAAKIELLFDSLFSKFGNASSLEIGEIMKRIEKIGKNKQCEIIFCEQ